MFFLQNIGTAQEVNSHTNQFHSFTTADGLSSNQILSITQDNKGFLWIGTNEGLNRFDGRDFAQFFHNPADTKHSLSGNSVNGITAFGDILFISTNHGVSVFNTSTQRFENELLDNSMFNFLSKELINYMVRLGERWYVGGEKLLLELNADFSLRKNLMELLPEENRNTARDFIEPAMDADGLIYFPSCGSTLCYNPAKDEVIKASASQTEFNQLQTSACITAALFLHDSHRMVFSQWSLNPFVMDMQSQSIQHSIAVSSQQPAFNGSTQDIFQLDDNTLWLAGDYGLAAVNMIDFSCAMLPLNEKKSSPSACNAIMRDTQGNLWIASESGLYQWSQKKTHFDVLPIAKSFIQTTNVFAQQFLLHGGKMYYIKNEGDVKSIFRIEDGKSVSVPVAYVEGGARSMASINDDEIVLGGWKSLNTYSPTTNMCASFDWMPDDLKDKSFICVLIDSHNHIWVSLAAGFGVLRHDFASGTTIHYVNDKALKPHQQFLLIANAYDMIEDALGNVWMVRSKLDGKLIKWNCKTDAFEEIHPRNSEAANMNFNNESYCVAAQRNVVWFGVVREGLFRYDIVKNEMQQFTRLDGLPSNDVYSLELDGSGRVWIGTVQGLSCFDYSKSTFTNFSEMNGLPAAEFNSASLFDSHSGRMYFSCSGHVISFKPDDVLQEPATPNVFLTSVKVEGQDDALQPRYFYPGENHFDFAFTAVDLSHAAGFEYRYQLEGLDGDWILAGKNKTASYANIPPGKYQFTVSVKVGGEWRKGVVLYSFTLPEYFFKTWWFVVLLCLLFCAGIYFIYRQRIRRMKQLETVRSRISRDLHDDIGSALSSIRILSGQQKQDESAKSETLSRIHHSSQKMLDNMDDIIWTINPQNDKGEHLLTRMREFAGELLEAAGIDYALHFDDELGAVHFNLNQKRNIYLIFKEALNNAVKYADAKTIDVRFKRRDKSRDVLLSVHDDGSGFDSLSFGEGRGEASPGLQPPSPKEKGSGKLFLGNGLINMKTRAAEINGQLEIETRLGRGTTVRLHFPL